MGDPMRPLDEHARLGNDTTIRMPPGTFFRVPWSWPLAAAAGGALMAFVGTGSTQVALQPSEPRVAADPVSPGNCRHQTWPHLSDECLERSRPAAAPKTVRVIRPDEAMAKAAIGATEWSRRAASSPIQPQQKGQRAKEHRQGRVKTARPGRRNRSGEPQRVYRVPPGAYHAYGYAPR
jgi:hypothetical protein